MSQFDFGNLESPLSRTTFINGNLEPWRDALHSLHMGNTRPSYAVPGMMWIDDTTNPWLVKVFNGSSDTSIGSIDTTTNTFSYIGEIRTDNLEDESVTAAKISSGGATIGQVLMADGGGGAAFDDIGQMALLDKASQAEAEAGSSDTVGMTPLRTAQAIAALSPPALISAAFTSAEQTITNSAVLTISHGLGVVPKFVILTLVCKTANLGYAVGEVVEIGMTAVSSPGVGNFGVSVRKTTTELKLKTAATGVSIVSLTDGGVAAITNGSWRYVLNAYA